MKILKYENNVSFLNVDGVDKKILEITKDDILKVLEYIYNNDDVELEEFDKDRIVNEAEKIVYENLYSKLNSFNVSDIKIFSNSDLFIEFKCSKYSLYNAVSSLINLKCSLILIKNSFLYSSAILSNQIKIFWIL